MQSLGVNACIRIPPRVLHFIVLFIMYVSVRTRALPSDDDTLRKLWCVRCSIRDISSISTGSQNKSLSVCIINNTDCTKITDSTKPLLGCSYSMV